LIDHYFDGTSSVHCFCAARGAAFVNALQRRFSLLLDFFRFTPIALRLHKLSPEARRLGIDAPTKMFMLRGGSQ
jgi:hypothetical protein